MITQKVSRTLDIHDSRLRTGPAVAAGLLVMVCLGSGCACHLGQTASLRQHWLAGNFPLAAEQAVKDAEKRGAGKDAVIWRLEEGAALRAAGQYEESNRAFDQAEERINQFEEAAKIKLGQEALAIVSNLAMLPYEGRAYDKVMMNTYKALNYVQLGDYEKARVEFNRALERQRDAVALNAARIERAQEQTKAQKQQVDLERVNSDQRLLAQLQANYADLDQMKAYADYVNPLAVYLDGLFSWHSPQALPTWSEPANRLSGSWA